MANIKRHRYLLDFLIYGNKKEKVAFLKIINKMQHKMLSKMFCDILDGKILMTDQQFKSLQKHKSFIRKVARGKATSTILARNHKILADIIKIILNHYEICTKISSGSYRRVGQSKTKRSSPETSDGEYSSSESSDISTSESNTSTRIRENSCEKSSGGEIEGDDSFFISKTKNESFDNIETYKKE